MIKRTRQDMLGMTIMAHNGDCDCGACRYADAMHQLAIADAEIAALNARIKDLEAALKEIQENAHGTDYSGNLYTYPAPCSCCEDVQEIARKGLTND